MLMMAVDKTPFSICGIFRNTSLFNCFSLIFKSYNSWTLRFTDHWNHNSNNVKLHHWFLDAGLLNNNVTKFRFYLLQILVVRRVLFAFSLLKVIGALNILQWRSSQIVIHRTLGRFQEQKIPNYKKVGKQLPYGIETSSISAEKD